MLATQAGVILGTAAYMSPEQAKGLPADHRSDVFSFGAVLFEMLSGRQPFQGDTAPDILASVLVRDPDFTALPRGLNPRLVDLVRRCLEKNPRRRWQAIGDVRAELDTIAANPRGPAEVAGRPTVSQRWRYAAGLAVTAIVAAALGAVLARSTPAVAPPPVVRFPLVLTGETLLGSRGRTVAISPDGTRIA